jgi:hypothetical protein
MCLLWFKKLLPYCPTSQEAGLDRRFATDAQIFFCFSSFQDEVLF